MYDQAEKLRGIIKKLKKSQVYNSSENVIVKEKRAKVITVTSGKGGVGKTNITVNLAIALRELGNRVIIIDADFGLANVDVLFGMIPRYSLADVIYNNKNILEVMSEDPSSKVKFISGGSGVEELAKIDKLQLDKFVKNISMLDKLTDIILVDTGAGISDKVLSFVMASDEVVLITTPEPTSMTDAYALIKMISRRDTKKKIEVVVNMAESHEEANEIIRKLNKVSNKFLSLDLDFLGYILKDEIVIKAVKLQKPFSLSYPRSNAAKRIREISKKLGKVEDEKITGNGMKTFVNRIVDFLTA
ncbi:MAG: MinD/ParA family protein [Clostridiales bacterium]